MGKKAKLKTAYIKVVFFLIFLTIGLFFGVPFHVFCQNGGFKYFRNYTPNEYLSSPQNWAILQDKRGFIYAANHGGVLQFDGVSWRAITIPNWSVRSLAIDEAGTIYVGGNNEIGFLHPNQEGTLQYVSLLKHISEYKNKFSNVWKTHATKEGIYFRTSKYLFRWNPNFQRMNIWKPKERFNVSFKCRGKYFIHDRTVGLMHVVDDSLELTPGGDALKGKKIYMIAPYRNNTRKLLIGTRSEGFFVYDGSVITPFSTDVEGYLNEKMLYYGIRLSSPAAGPAEFALATLRGGLVIIDDQGNLKHIFDKKSGLLEDDVKYVFEDSQGNLWLAMDKGISKIEYASPFSIYDKRANLPGLVLSVTKPGLHNNLYCGTTKGLFSFTSAGQFRRIPEMPHNCYFLLSVGNSLLAATTEGVFQVVNDIPPKKIIEDSSYVLVRAQKDPQRVWVGTREGLISLSLNPTPKNQYHKKQCTLEYRFNRITEKITTIVEDKTGNLWLGTVAQGVVNVSFPIKGNISQTIITRYHQSHRLPAGEVNVVLAAGHIVFLTGKGIFRFDEKNKVFLPDYTLGDEFANGSRNVFRLAEDLNKNIWLHSNLRNYQAIPQPDGSFVIHATPFLRIPKAQVNAFYSHGDKVWFASNDGLICYNKKVRKNYQFDFSTYVRSVGTIDGKLLIFDGYSKENKPGAFIPIIEYKNRNIRFKFAAPFFENESETLYRRFLEGYDREWSAWVNDTRADYTNLNSGAYAFRVQSKNIYGHLSRETRFRFRVLPPWYSTWWAFTFYIMGFFLGVFLIVKWRSKRLEKEKKALERIIKERTVEIQDQKRQLENQTFQLKKQSEKLEEIDKVKSRFFANISHEFRTPLTLIMGPLEQMILSAPDPQQEKKLDMMRRNSQRLLRLINQLLDLSRFDSGKMKLKAAYQNIVPYVEGILASFQQLALQNKLEMEFHCQTKKIFLYFDPPKMEDVLCNLLINAIKYTPAAGKITVLLNISQDYTLENADSPGFLEISIRDTGIGIPQKQLTQIFDRFYQVESSDYQGQGYKGTGIGLALAKEVVSLHHGKINVHSTEGKGTEFVIRLPMGKGHLKPNEMVEPPSVREPAQERGVTAALDTAAEKEVETEATSPGDNHVAITGDGTNGEPGEKKENVVLVVEDNADVRTYIREPLEPYYTVVEAVDGEEGIQKAREIIPDLIISDVMMPKTDGYELCRVLKKDIKTSHIPIIILTAKASDASIVQGLETGADDYITKPFNTKILGTRIKNLIDLRSQLQEKFQRQMMLQPTEISVSSMDQKFLKELQNIIEKNLSDPDFNVEAFSNKLDITRVTLNKKLQALTGQSPTELIRSYRLKRAAQLLKDNFGNITDVAFEVGFSSTAYFTKCFKEKFHRLPSEYQDAET